MTESTNKNKKLKGFLSKHNKTKEKCPNRGSNIDKPRVVQKKKECGPTNSFTRAVSCEALEIGLGIVPLSSFIARSRHERLFKGIAISCNIVEILGY
jgi:hypothetical protein